tara:strand:+ start:258 stop:1286 length:1029 start_codon:yes stop_codon:yes gene_type:complete
MSKNGLIISSTTKRTHEDLKRLQALPLIQKIPLTLRRISQFYNYYNGEVYIAFSGGKDSTVLAELVWSMYPDVVGVFSNTGLEYPEIVAFVKKKKAEGRNIEIVRPKKNFKQVIEKYGWAVVSKVQSMAISRYRNTKDPLQKEYRTTGCKNGVKIGMAGVISKKHQYLIDAPFKISESCCEALKKSPFKVYQKGSGKAPIIGTMAHESKLRKDGYIKYGCNAFDKKNPMSTPMAFWTEQDVLKYIVDNDVDYCREIYGEVVERPRTRVEYLLDLKPITYRLTGEQRTGCMWCMFGLEQETKASGDGTNRFTRMKKSHPKQYDAVLNKYGGKEVLDYMNLPYE